MAVINYNTGDLLRDCLTSSIMANNPVRLVVADDGSTEGIVERVTAEFPNAPRLVDATNPGHRFLPRKCQNGQV